MSRLHVAVVLAAATLAAHPAAAAPVAPGRPIAAVAAEAGALVFWGRDDAPAHEVWRADAGGPMRRVARVEPVRDPKLAAALLKEGKDALSQSLTLADDVHQKAEADPRLDELFMLASSGYARVRGAAWLDTTAPRGVACRWRVVATGPAGEVVLGEAAATPGRPVPPPAPAPVADGDRLRWEAAPFTAYEVRRAATREGPFASATPLPVPGRAAAGPAAWSDAQAPQDGATRWYQVVPLDLLGRAGAPSTPVAVVTPDRTPPAPPSGVQTKGVTGGLALRWTPSASPDARAQHVYRTELTAGPGAARPVAGKRARLTAQPLAADAAAYEDLGAAGGKLYQYDVTALDAAGNESAPSAGALGAPRDATPPATPAGLELQVGRGGEVSLSWAPVKDADLWVYRVLHATGPKEPLRIMVDVEPPAGGARVTRAVRLDPRSQATHRFAVAAVDRSENESLPSPALEVRLPDVVPPAAPVITALDAEAAAVTVRWAAPPEQDLAGFHLMRREAGKAPVRLTPKPLPADARSFRDAAAPAGVALAYAVSALDRVGNEGPSSEARSTATFAPPPAPPTGLAVRAAGPDRLALSWTALPGSRGTMVYGATTRDGAPRQVGALATGSSLEVARSAGPFFRVQAVAADGTPSDLSAPVEAPPGRPPTKGAASPARKAKVIAMRTSMRTAALAAALLSLVACSQAPTTRRASARVSVGLGRAQAQLPGATRLALAVTAADMAPVSADLPLDGTTLTLEVPAGKARLFTLDAFGAAGRTHTGSTLAPELVPGAPVRVTIRLTPLGWAGRPLALAVYHRMATPGLVSAVEAVREDGKARVTLATAADGGDVRYAGQSGGRVLFTRTPPGGLTDVWSVLPDGTGEAAVHRAEVTGASLAATLGDTVVTADDGTLFLSRADGGAAPVRLGDGSGVQQRLRSDGRTTLPDGQAEGRFWFLAVGAGRSGTWSIGPGEAAPSLVTAAYAEIVAALDTPAGRRVFLAGNLDGQLFATDPTGAPAVQLASDFDGALIDNGPPVMGVVRPHAAAACPRRRPGRLPGRRRRRWGSTSPRWGSTGRARRR